MNTFLKLEDRAQKLTGKRATFHEHLLSLRDDPYSSFSSIAAPLELSHENASLPQVRERVRLDGHYIHPELAAIYSTPGIFDRPLEELPAQSPVACSRVEHWPSLAGRMYDLSMLELMLPSTTPCLAGRAATSQFFGVAKKDSQLLRVILDRRPRNCMEKTLHRVLVERLLDGRLAPDVFHHLVRLLALPHPVQLTDLMIGPSETLRVSSEDVAEFYHSLQWPRTSWAEDAVGSLVYPLELLPFVQDAERRNELLRGCLPTLGVERFRPC